LVVGVETLPAWFREGGLFGVDLGGITGQLGIGNSCKPFEHNGVKIAPAICYEGLYGDYMGEFIRNGAQIIGVISNDGWWGDTWGYKYLYAFCRLRAIEHRRDIVRSANTGISGFINSRGDSLESLGWDKQGVITSTLRLNDQQTIYTRYGDYIGRLSLYVALLCLLYTIAILSKRKFYLD
jgi:apolipoprotein N-acyltransferase